MRISKEFLPGREFQHVNWGPLKLMSEGGENQRNEQFLFERSEFIAS